MRRGLPIVVHGDGTSLWTLTHARDFAVAFVGLLGNPVAVGDTFQITSDFVYPWDAIYRMLGAARRRGTAARARRLGGHRGGAARVGVPVSSATSRTR